LLLFKEFTAFEELLADGFLEPVGFAAGRSSPSSNVRVCETTIFLESLLNSITLKSKVSSILALVPSSLRKCFAGQIPSTPYGKATIPDLS